MLSHQGAVPRLKSWLKATTNLCNLLKNSRCNSSSPLPVSHGEKSESHTNRKRMPNCPQTSAQTSRKYFTDQTSTTIYSQVPLPGFLLFFCLLGFFFQMRPACYLVRASEQHLISPLDPVNTSWKATPIMTGHCLSRSGIHSSNSQEQHPCRPGSRLCLGRGPQFKFVAHKGKELLVNIYSATASSPALS